MVYNHLCHSLSLWHPVLLLNPCHRQPSPGWPQCISILSLLPTSSLWRPLPTQRCPVSQIINLTMSLSSYGLEAASHCLWMESQVPTKNHLVFHCHSPALPCSSHASLLVWTPPPRELHSSQPHNSAQPLRCQLTVITLMASLMPLAKEVPAML